MGILNEGVNQEKKALEIKKAIKQLVEFDIEGSYYRAEAKTEVVKCFRKVLFHDDIAVKAFLKELFQRMKELATEKDLLPSEREEYETDEEKERKEGLEDENPVDEKSEGQEGGEEGNEHPTEESEEQPPREDEMKNESISRTVQIASRFLTE